MTTTLPRLVTVERSTLSGVPPVVPPMVSASTGALLVPYAAAGQARLTLLAGCYAMFGMSLFASVIVITSTAFPFTSVPIDVSPRYVSMPRLVCTRPAAALGCLLT